MSLKLEAAENRLEQLFLETGFDANHPAMLDWATVKFALLDFKRLKAELENRRASGWVPSEPMIALRDYLVEYDFAGEDGDIPDEIWLPFCNALKQTLPSGPRGE